MQKNLSLLFFQNRVTFGFAHLKKFNSYSSIMKTPNLENIVVKNNVVDNNPELLKAHKSLPCTFEALNSTTYIVDNVKTISESFALQKDMLPFLLKTYLKVEKIQEILVASDVASSKQNEKLYEQNQRLLAESELLRGYITELKRIIDEMREEQKKLAELEKIKQEKREKKRNRKLQPKRDRLTKEEFTWSISTISGYSYVQTRTLVILVLLYITGLRTGNLAVVTVKLVNEMLSKGETRLRIIKNGPPNHQIKLSPDQLLLLKDCRNKIAVLFKNKNPRDFAFTPEDKPDGTCTVWVYKKVLNTARRKLAEKTGKRVTTHSFRVSMVSDLLEGMEINEVRKIIGDSSIIRTAVYESVRAPFKKAHENLDARRGITKI